MYAHHPERSLARAIAGTLSSSEREALEEHLAECAACRAHLVLASAAEDAFERQPGDDFADQLHVDRALASFASTKSHAAQSNPAVRRAQYEARAPRRGVRWSVWLSAAAILVFGGVAAAAWMERARERTAEEAKVVVTPLGSATKVVKKRAPSVAVEPEAKAEPEPQLEIVAPAPPAASVSPTHSAPESAASLFRKASSLRADGEADAAIATFLKLQRSFPESRESTLSLLVAGRLLLERGRPKEALDEFDRYLKQSGAASEHALAGRAGALQALGRGDAEASTWQRLLSANPQSVYGKRARSRLLELGVKSPGATGATP